MLSPGTNPPYHILYPFIALKVHGKLKGIAIFSEQWWGRQVSKLYYPTQARTLAQQMGRWTFYNASYNWKHFDQPTKNYYNALVKGKPTYGYGRFVQLFFKANYPMIIYWNTLEKSASDPALIQEYIASGYMGSVKFARGAYWGAQARASGVPALIPDYIASTDFIRGLNVQPVTWDRWSEAKATWTRTGDHVFTEPGDVTAKYPKGTRIRYKQGGAYEYGVVISAVHSAGTTTITLATNTTYAMAAAAITDNYYSYESCPQGYPGWFNRTPVYDGFSSDPSSVGARFEINGSTCHYIHADGGDGTSDATNFTITVPVTPKSVSNLYIAVRAGLAVDNSVQLSTGVVRLLSSETLFKVFPTVINATWTASGGKRVQFEIFYEI